MELHPVQQSDLLGLSVLLSTVFDRRDELLTVDQLRSSGQLAAEFTAKNDNGIFAYIGFAELQSPREFWHLALTAVSVPMQGKGIGSSLIANALDKARFAGIDGVVVVGPTDFYSRFGFSTQAAQDMARDLDVSGVSFKALRSGVTTLGRQLRFAPAFTARYT